VRFFGALKAFSAVEDEAAVYDDRRAVWATL